MANEASVQKLAEWKEKFEKLDRSAVLRPQLAELSLAPIEPILDEIAKKLRIAFIAPRQASESAVASFNARLEGIMQFLDQARAQTPEQFVAHRSNVIQQVESYIEAIRADFSPFVAVAVEATGLLDGADVALRKIEERGAAFTDALEKKGAQILDAATTKASEIEGKARATAKGVSFRAAQDQFEHAHKNLRWKAILWSVISAVVFGSFLIVAIYLLRHPPAHNAATSPTGDVTGSSPAHSVPGAPSLAEAIYYIAIRLTVLTALAGLATFCFRIMRAHLHMNEYNLHRKRVANSISAFVEAGETPEQRDAILARLVDSVTGFGHSGLVEGGEDHLSVPTVAIDTFIKGADTRK